MIANAQEHYCNSTLISDFANSCADMENDRELIQALSSWVGVTPSEVARRAGLAVTTLTRPLNHPVKHRLSVPTLTKLRETFPDFPGFARQADLPPGDTSRDYVSVEILPTYAGMGGGGDGNDEPEYGLVPRALIESELRAKPGDFLLIDTRGDSMEPDFHHGDQILIDRRDTNPVQPGYFALWDGDGYVIKNVERVGGTLRIFSSNAKYREWSADIDDIKIMGRPVWFARRL